MSHSQFRHFQGAFAVLFAALLPSSVLAASGRWASFSPRLGTSVVTDAPSTWTWSPANRAEAMDAYWNIYVPNSATPFSSTSNVATLTVGETSPAWRAATIHALNFQRRVLWGDAAVYGVDRSVDAHVGFDSAIPAGAFTTQQAVDSAAVLLAANQFLNHYPASTVPGYSAAAAAGCANSNLQVSLVDAEFNPIDAGNCVQDFLFDGGDANYDLVGHRWWMMSPSTAISTGSALNVSGFFPTVLSALDVDSTFWFPKTPYPDGILVTWPAQNAWIPYQWIGNQPVSWGLRMSAFLTNIQSPSNPHPNVSNVGVTVKRDGVPLTISGIRWTDCGLTWETVIGSYNGAPPADQLFEVTISNVYGGKTLSYSFHIVDPAAVVPVVFTTPSPVVNAATRRSLGASLPTAAATFAITGPDPLKVALRALGTSLAVNGVTNPAAAPRVALYRNVDGHNVAVGTTKGWKAEANWRLVQSYSLAPSSESESAAIATLLPGVYTAVLSDATGGVASFEVIGIDSVSASALASVSVANGQRLDLSVAPVSGSTYQWRKAGQNIAGATGASFAIAAANPDSAGAYDCAVTAAGTTKSATIAVLIDDSPFREQSTVLGATVQFAQMASSSAAKQWQINGTSLSGANASLLSLTNVQPADSGLYSLVTTEAGVSTTSDPSLLGLTSSTKFVGPAAEVGSNIFVAANGNTFDQILLKGAAAVITADYAENQITRMSFVDLNNDIVQVELSGPGSMSLVLDASSGPALPVNYNQDVLYMKGHAGIVITGATEFTNVSVFSVGRITAVNQALFRDSVSYDGIADIAFIAIASANGKFGGVRTANAHYFAAKGFTGLYAPDVEFVGPVYLGNVTAFGTAKPVIRLGSADGETRITGGDLLQDNGQAVQVSGLTKLKFVSGTDSHGNVLAARTNRATLTQDGSDVTSAVVVNP